MKSRIARICNLHYDCVRNGAHAQTVKVNWRANTSFSDFKTYAWVQSAAQAGPGLVYRQWVEPDVNARLAAKGLKLINLNQHPDLLVAYHVRFQELLDTTTTSDGFSWGGPWGFWGGWGGWGDYGDFGPDFSTTQERPRTMGILTVDIANAKKQLLWRGQATVDSVSKSQKGDEKQVKKCVEKMFDNFPPKGD
jgi:hypothetical protein